MSSPIFCSGCRKVIGVSIHQRASFYPCPVKEQHEEKKHTVTSLLFGWIKLHRVFYPETNTDSRWYEWAGPKMRQVLSLN